ncbi:helix-turn-helix domain-containing protein [Streptomonospora sediminis]
MQRPHSPSIRRRRLSAELRHAREKAGLTTPQVVQHMKWAAGKLSKIENAETQSVKAADLDSLLDLYKITAESKRDALHQLAREAKDRGWWAKYKDVFKNEALPDFEAEASSLRCYESQVLPGLLQIPEYTEAIFRGSRYTDEREVQRRVEARMQRRGVLTRFEPVRLSAVIDEAVLHRTVGSTAVMIRQLEYLLHMAQMPHIDVQVLPLTNGAHAALTAPFTILDFPNPIDPTIVCIEMLAQALYLELPDEIQVYTVTFGDVQGSAISASESARLIRDRVSYLEGIS